MTNPASWLRDRLEDGRLIQQAARAQLMREILAPDPSPDVAPCPAHPEWQPPRRGMQPRHRLAECPLCKEDAERARATEREAIEIPHPLQVHDSHRFERVWEQPGPAPGSVEEVEALEKIDEARESAIEHDRKRDGTSGYVAIERLEHGRVTQYRKVKAVVG